jgi:phosphatidylglycerol---prolipoprotein diacylglyceryl transferase
MQQVLLRIPLKADWLPAGLPLWLVLLVVILALAAALYAIAPLAPRWKIHPKNVQAVAGWVAVAGLVVGALAYFFADTGLPIYGFGMMLFLAFLACNWVGGRRAEREGVPKEVVQDLGIWLIVGGLIGARLTSVFSSGLLRESLQSAFGQFISTWDWKGLSEVLWKAFIQFISIWDGGIVLYGAVIGGMVAYVFAYILVFRKIGVSTLKLADILAPTLTVGLCLGRIGCFLNGCCYGQVAAADCPICAVSFPLSAPPRYEMVREGYQTAAGFTLAADKADAVVAQVEPGSSADRAGLKAGDVIVKADGAPLTGEESRANLDEYMVKAWPRGKNDLTLVVRGGDGATRTMTLRPWTLGLHPTQLYEVVSMILLFLLLTAYYPFRRHDGQVVAVLMICYAAHRYLNEMLRADERPVGFENWTSVILFVAGVALWLYLWRQPAQYRYQTASDRAAA